METLVRCKSCGKTADIADWVEFETPESQETGVTERACPFCGGYEYDYV